MDSRDFFWNISANYKMENYIELFRCTEIHLNLNSYNFYLNDVIFVSFFFLCRISICFHESIPGKIWQNVNKNYGNSMLLIFI